nr:(d)CMP kinase [Chitinophagales bacterium]
MKRIIIAIDGHSSCGKSTLARALANHFHYLYIDSGAMYRCVTLYILQNNISPDNDAAIIATLPNINIHFTHINGQIETYLNGQNVEKQIREDKQIANHVSTVAAIPAVRQFLVKQQQQLGINKGIIMDGRDIGTVVFPDAELKFFLTASLD